MNELIVRTAVVAALIVIFCGCVLLVTLAFYGVVKMWWKMSRIGKTMRLYLLNKMDFLSWRSDFIRWENCKRSKVDNCRSCEYRRRCLEDKEDE